MFGKFLNACAELIRYRHDRDYLEWRLKYSKVLKKYKNIHSGADCFIVGNGPSLNKIDLGLLNRYYTFGLNKIYLMFDKTEFRPSYHVAVNPLVIEQSVKEFEGLSCDTFLSYRPSRHIIKKHEHINFIMTGGPVAFSQDLVGEINEGWTVTYVAMQIAFYMGFKNIFLIGVDHNFVVNGEPNEKQLLTDSDVNHFDPNYFGGKLWHLPDLEGSELSYRLAKFFFERDGRCISDATIGGKLQIFPKISFEDALRVCKKKDK